MFKWLNWKTPFQGPFQAGWKFRGCCRSPLYIHYRFRHWPFGVETGSLLRRMALWDCFGDEF